MASPAQMLTFPELNKIAERLLRDAVATLTATGNFDPAIYLIGPNGQLETVPFDARALNSNTAKEVLFTGLRRIIAITRSQAAFVLTDGYTVAYSPEEMRLLGEDSEFANRHFETTRKLSSVDEVVAAGFGRKVEAAFVTVQSPTVAIMMVQQYERSGPKQKTITLLEKQVFDTNEGGICGRLALFGHDADEKDEEPSE